MARLRHRLGFCAQHCREHAYRGRRRAEAAAGFLPTASIAASSGVGHLESQYTDADEPCRGGRAASASRTPHNCPATYQNGNAVRRPNVGSGHANCARACCSNCDPSRCDDAIECHDVQHPASGCYVCGAALVQRGCRSHSNNHHPVGIRIRASLDPGIRLQAIAKMPKPRSEPPVELEPWIAKIAYNRCTPRGAPCSASILVSYPMLSTCK